MKVILGKLNTFWITYYNSNNVNVNVGELQQTKKKSISIYIIFYMKQKVTGVKNTSNLTWVIKQPFHIVVHLSNVLIIFFATLSRSIMMYKKSNLFVYIFVVNCRFCPNNSITVCRIKLKIDMLYHMKNTFWNTVFLDIFWCGFKFQLVFILLKGA